MPPPAKRARTLDDYASFGGDATSGVYNERAAQFNRDQFLALLYSWILTDKMPFRKVKSPSFHKLLEYLRPRSQSLLPSHQRAKFHISFDLWISRNKLALLGLVAHFIDAGGTPVTTLLALPRQAGRHTGANLAETIGALIAHYNLQDRVGYFVTDNASNNDTCLDFLGREFGFKMPDSRIRCCGHIFNLCSQAVLFGVDAEAFEHEIEDPALEEVQLSRCRHKGPCGKLHNVIHYIEASPQRIDRLNDLELKLNSANQPPDKKAIYALVKDVSTWCNSFDKAIKRALYLRGSIDDFSGRPQPREPAIVSDMLTNDDWTVLTQYHELLQPLPEATVRLQGHAGGRFGCIWQLLPAFEYLLRHFEEQRQRHPVPAESSQLDPSLLTSESHFSTACNLGWQKLDEYYTKLDESPVYVAAVVLHPRLKWRWFRRWPEAWLAAAKIPFSKLWSHYAVKQTDASRRASRPPRKNDWFSDEEDEGAEMDEHDELNQYLVEHRPAELAVDDSLISYWLTKRQKWPRLSSLALDIYAVPAMSDSPKHLFSQAGDAASSRRRLLHSEIVEWLMSLKSWISSGLITLDPSLSGRILESPALGGDDGDDDDCTDLESDQSNQSNS
ncbi:Hypothetical protein D9617_87g078060 [Elsinoe fawcettii]|nr:Hypothetical protein D9617_87g078060 [Elsinoe fawcettii]